MADQKKSPYRIKDSILKAITISVFVLMGVGIIGGFAFAAIASSMNTGTNDDWIMITSYILILGVGIGLPLLIGAVFGGLAIHPAGPVATLLIVGGIVPVVMGRIQENTWLNITGIAIILIGVGLIYYLGKRAKVPIWLQAPTPGSPRLYVANKPGSKKNTSKDK